MPARLPPTALLQTCAGKPARGWRNVVLRIAAGAVGIVLVGAGLQSQFVTPAQAEPPLEPITSAPVADRFDFVATTARHWLTAPQIAQPVAPARDIPAKELAADSRELPPASVAALVPVREIETKAPRLIAQPTLRERFPDARSPQVAGWSMAPASSIPEITSTVVPEVPVRAPRTEIQAAPRRTAAVKTRPRLSKSNTQKAPQQPEQLDRSSPYWKQRALFFGQQ